MDAPTPESPSVVFLEEEVQNNETKALWVFAYGSLCWKPGFEFKKAAVGYVKGFARKFWQGNTTHRGTEDKPGRVATLVREDAGRVHGVAYAISSEAAIPYLSKRECELGGYVTHFTNFYPANGEPFNVLVYLATPTNPHWLGDAHESEIANQIVDCSGPSGHNVEYLLRLASFMRHHFPTEEDRHLYELEKEVKDRIKDKNMCLTTLMGDGRGCVTFMKQGSRSPPPQNQEVEHERVQNFQHTTRVPEKTLRCLNI